MPSSTVPYDAQQAALNRRRALAQALQQQSMQPLAEPSVRGARISKWEGVNKLAEALVGGYQNSKLDTEQGALSGQIQTQREAQARQMLQSLLQPTVGGNMQFAQPGPQQAMLPGDTYRDNAGEPNTAIRPDTAGYQNVPLPASQGQYNRQAVLAQALAPAVSSQDEATRQLGMLGLQNALAGKTSAEKVRTEADQRAQELTGRLRERTQQQDFTASQSNIASERSRAEGALNRQNQLDIANIRNQDKPAETTLTHTNVNLDGKPAIVLADNKGNFFDVATRQPVNGRITPYVAPPSPRQAGDITPTAEAGLIQSLNKQWETASKDVQALYRANTIMQTGMDAARKGDMNAGSQAVLVTIQKFLDPTSVVRESEYARSGQGQSMANRVRGIVSKLADGGAGMTLPELEKFAEMGQEIANNLNKEGGSLLTAERDRIGKIADRYHIPLDMVVPKYDYSVAGGGQPKPDNQAAPAEGGVTVLERGPGGKLRVKK